MPLLEYEPFFDSAPFHACIPASLLETARRGTATLPARSPTLPLLPSLTRLIMRFAPTLPWRQVIQKRRALMAVPVRVWIATTRRGCARSPAKACRSLHASPNRGAWVRHKRVVQLRSNVSALAARRRAYACDGSRVVTCTKTARTAPCALRVFQKTLPLSAKPAALKEEEQPAPVERPKLLNLQSARWSPPRRTPDAKLEVFAKSGRDEIGRRERGSAIAVCWCRTSALSHLP